MNATKNQIVVSQLEIAESVVDRMVGLLKRKKISSEEGLWIRPGYSIHTWLMRFPIDVVFVDKSLKVKSVHHHVKPWRLIIAKWGVHSVFELCAGRAQSVQLEKGDQLNVVD